MSVNETVTILIAYIKVNAKLKFIRRVKGFIILKTQIQLLFKSTTFKMVPVLIRAINYYSVSLNSLYNKLPV